MSKLTQILLLRSSTSVAIRKTVLSTHFQPIQTTRNIHTSILPCLTSLQAHSKPDVLARVPEPFDPILWSSSEPDAPGQKPVEQPDTGKPTEYELRRIASILHKTIVTFMLDRPDYSVYDKDIVLEDRIRNKVVEGGIAYIKQMSLLKILLHLKFIYTKINVTSVDIDEDDASIQIKWEIRGLGAIKTFIYYIPKQLFKRKNMEAFAPVWKAGVSTYFVNNGRIHRQIIDQKEMDKGMKTLVNNPVEKMKEKMAKLKKEAVPSPVMYRKFKHEK